MAILPYEEGEEALSFIAQRIKFSEVFEDRSEDLVYASIPEFVLDFDVELTDICKGIGMKTVFTDEADFSTMSDTKSKLEKIIHKVRLDVDRKGTKADAVTIAETIATGAPPEHETVILDRPFIYAIMHNETGLPVLAGVYNRKE